MFTQFSTRVLSLLLGAIALTFFLPGFFSLPPMDRDEPRFAQAAKQMLETGDFVAIRFQEEARNKKPVGIYWAQAISVALGEKILGPSALKTIWLYRVPSLLAALLSVLLTFWIGLNFLSKRASFYAACLMAATILLNVEAHLSKTDAVLTALNLTALGALMPLWLDRHVAAQRNGLALVFWTALAVGILIKGPIVPLIVLATLVPLCWRERSLSWLRPLRPILGLIWCLLLVAPWLILIELKTRGAFFADSIGGDMLGKVTGGQESHGAPPLTYFAWFWITGWPMAPFAALAFPWIWRHVSDDRVCFLLAWLVPTWLIFELTPTKLPHYVLPLYPAIALLIAIVFDRENLGLARSWRRIFAYMLPGLPLIAILAVVGVASKIAVPLPMGFYLSAVALVGLSAYGTSRLRSSGDLSILVPLAPIFGWLFSILAYTTLGSPKIIPLFSPSVSLARTYERALAEMPKCNNRLAVASARYHEPSLVFLLGTQTLLTDAVGAAAFLNNAPCRVAFVEKHDRAIFDTALAKDIAVGWLDHVQALTLNGGKTVDIDVFMRGAE